MAPDIETLHNKKEEVVVPVVEDPKMKDKEEMSDDGKEVVESKGSAKKGEKRASNPVTPIERPSRERKTVERYQESTGRLLAPKPFSVEKGSGTQLKEIPNVAFKLSKRKPDDNLQSLHMILFNKRAKVNTLKKNIGLFSGFVWADDEQEKQRTKLKEKLDKFTKEKLFDFCDILNLQILKSTLKKEDVSLKLLEFLQSPHATTELLLAEKEQKGKKQKASAKKSRTLSSEKQSGEKRKRSSKTKEENNVEEAEGSESEGDESQEEDGKNTPSKPESDEEEDKSDEGGDEDEEEPEKEPTPKKVSSKKSVKKDSGTKTVEKSKAVKKDDVKTPTKSNKKSSTSGPKKEASNKKPEVEKSSKKVETKVSAKKESAKEQGKGKTNKKAKAEPTNEEMHAVVVGILKEVDFNTATLSDIIKQLGTHFGQDLLHRKGEVKGIITDVINNMSGDEDDEEEKEKEAEAEVEAESGSDEDEDGENES